LSVGRRETILFAQRRCRDASVAGLEALFSPPKTLFVPLVILVAHIRAFIVLNDLRLVPYYSLLSKLILSEGFDHSEAGGRPCWLS